MFGLNNKILNIMGSGTSYERGVKFVVVNVINTLDMGLLNVFKNMPCYMAISQNIRETRKRHACI